MNYLTLDIGGSSIKYAIVNKEGEFLEKGNAPAPKDGIDQFVSIIGDLYDKYKNVKSIDVIGKFSINVFNNIESVNLIIEDINGFN